MFGMGFTEILMIAIVAIIFLGPEKLPKFLVDIAKFFKGIKRAINEAKSNIEREVEISELKEEALSYREKFRSISDDVASIRAELEEDSLQEAREIKRATEEPKREVVHFKKKSEKKDGIDV
ncbi:MAG: Sec-independent protein translocase subunit TatB [Epsilonproteobacteria bacterium]|nr:twin-arginine translocase subunit TatB [Campylobacterota bacterium]NPA57313.1 Sec-independent protein translocase subunit TatB [Campylobacterota bacterium]